MEKLKLIMFVLAMAVLGTIACLAFVMALRDIFGKSMDWKPALFAAACLWIAIGGSILWDHLRAKKNPRS